MGYNIGPKIGIDGEAQFRQQIKAINNEYKTLQAQTKALTAEFDKNDDQQGKLKMQTQQLEKQIENQKRAIEQMEKALEAAENTTDTNSDAVTTWKGKLYDAQATVSQLEKELEDAEDALRKMEDGIEDTAEAADDAGDEVSQFGDILDGDLVADALLDALKEAAQLLIEVGKSSIEAASNLRAESAQFEQTFGEMEQAATNALKSLETQTGISATRIKGNFSTVYAFAKTMGADSEEALSIASRAMVAAADSAAYYDRTMEEATETIQAYIKGNFANDAALGIASTENTRNAKAMELYAKSFKELTEAQKVDTLLAMVEAGNKASGAMGQAARESSEWTNVTGELEDAQKQLLAVIGEPILETAIPIVQRMTQAMREMVEVTPGEEMAKGMGEFVSTLEEVEQAYDSTMASTMATATVAERYVQQLKELEKQGLNTAEAHEKYRSLVEQLNTIMPQLNVTINEQTGLINQNTSALLGDIEAWKEAATTQAMYDKMKDKLEAYGQMKMKVAEGSDQIDDLETQRMKKLLELTYQLNSAEIDRIEYSKAVPKNTNVVIEYYKAYDKAGNLIKTFSDTLGTEQTATLKLAKSIHETDKNITELEDSVKEAEAAIAEYDAEMNELIEVMENYRNSADATTDAENAQREAIRETQAALKELETAYQEAEKSTRAMLDSSIGLWDGIAEESDWTAEKVLENWRSQMRAFDQYSENLKKAAGMGISDGIIEALSDGSEQSMQILDAMVNQSQYSVGEINAAFTNLGLAKDSTADVLVSLDKSLQEGYDKLVKDARAAGLEIVDGIVQAIEDNGYRVHAALIQSVNQRYEAAAVTSSMLSSMAPHFRVMAESASSPSAVSAVQNFYITQRPSESGDELAQRLAEMIAEDAKWKGGGLGG